MILSSASVHSRSTDSLDSLASSVTSEVDEDCFKDEREMSLYDIILLINILQSDAENTADKRILQLIWFKMQRLTPGMNW